MSVHPFQPRPIPAGDEPFLDADLDEHRADGLDADDDPDADIDDGDETLRRYGSIGRANRMAHRVINPSVLAAITGFPTDVCVEFHHALFTLLEDVGDFDGLLATPLVCIGRAEHVGAAQRWRAEHPPVEVDAMIDAADPDEADDDMWRRIISAVDADSLALAAVAGSNPSLTLGSIDAISLRIDQLLGDFVLSTIPEQVTALTRVALDLVARLPEAVVITGGATRATRLTRDTCSGWQS